MYEYVHYTPKCMYEFQVDLRKIQTGRVKISIVVYKYKLFQTSLVCTGSMKYAKA